MHAVITTSAFERQASQAGLTEDEVSDIISCLAKDALAGDIIVGTGGARKVRFAGKGKGKSGGYRTIHYYASGDVPIFLLALIDKGRKDNLSKSERNELALTLPLLGPSYRASVAKRVVKIRSP